MGPLHHIRLDGITDNCFADMRGRCAVTTMEKDNCGPGCPFYKPGGMSDWIRVGKYLVPPEEYKEFRLGGKK